MQHLPDLLLYPVDGLSPQPSHHPQTTRNLDFAHYIILTLIILILLIYMFVPPRYCQQNVALQHHGIQYYNWEAAFVKKKHFSKQQLPHLLFVLLLL